MSEAQVPVTTLNLAADAVTINKIKLHSANPGAAGATAVIAAAEIAVTYGAAVAGVRNPTGTPEIPVTEGATPTHYSLWNSTTFVYGNILLSNPDTFANDGLARITSAPFKVVDLFAAAETAIVAGYGEETEAEAIEAGLAALV